MKIRRILFLSFFILMSIIALPLASLSFFSTRSTLQDEIGHNLTGDATTLMDAVDMLMFERLQNIHSWSHLDIMQEARIGDIDKRLSQFLSELALSYEGMYQGLMFVDSQQRIVAASSPALIGQNFQATGDWLYVNIPNGYVTIENPDLRPPYENANFAIRAPVDDHYSSHSIGNLYGMFNMQQIFHILDSAINSRSGQRSIVLMDGKGRTIAASSNLRTAKYLLTDTFADWKPMKGEKFFVHTSNAIIDYPVLVGYAQSKGYLGYEQVGWSIIVFQSIEEAFLPIKVLWGLFTIVIILTVFLAMVASHWISGRISKPLLSLTHWVRDVRQFQAQPHPKLSGTVEINQLGAAFDEMLQELERSRIQIIQAAKLAVVGEMAAIMAHEVRTPLGILTTSAQWLQRELVLNADAKEMTQFILDESQRLNRLVTTLLECARPREPSMSLHNVHDLLGHAKDLLRSQSDKKQITFECQFSAQKSIIDCDSELLIQVFLNILLNAIQILSSGSGKIKICTTDSKAGLTIDFIDNGPGVDEQDIENLFAPFFTRREGGVGLGLTVTRQIIEAHHGHLTVSRSEWGGACFSIALPLFQEQKNVN